MKPPLLLASASARRRELLARVGVPFAVMPASIDERLLPGETPAAYVERIASSKAHAVAQKRPDAWVLAADTIVVAGYHVFGKAADENVAADMLRRLSSRTHTVMTCVALLCLLPPAGANVPAGTHFTVSTEVDMRLISEQEVVAYLRSGEWRGKAGAYAIQGIASAFVTSIRGSYTNVVGLPLAETLTALARLGAPTADLARGTPA